MPATTPKTIPPKKTPSLCQKGKWWSTSVFGYYIFQRNPFDNKQVILKDAFDCLKLFCSPGHYSLCATSATILFFIVVPMLIIFATTLNIQMVQRVAKSERQPIQWCSIPQHKFLPCVYVYIYISILHIYIHYIHTCVYLYMYQCLLTHTYSIYVLKNVDVYVLQAKCAEFTDHWQHQGNNTSIWYNHPAAGC